ncbi:MAG: hypothetical protein V4760_09650 [Bdellovibrionota bacterium]
MLSIFLTAATLLGPTAHANQVVDEQAFVQELETRMDRVPQFKFIREEAEKLGVKVYLFGGTAAAFGHYVRWDMLRERGDASYLKEFFDYDFFSIYRSTQDLDIVVDGSSKVAEELGRRLREKYPSFQGSKDSWEVRLLREAVGEKRALLGDADFNKQHSDSNSTGLIEVTRSNQPTVRDLRNWNEPRSRFLRDLAEGRISFYFSPEHETSARYLQGKNPPIYSVIRYLTKAFQFDLDLKSEDVVTIRKMIDSFDPSEPGRGIRLDTADFEFWMHGSESKLSNAKKLFQHAIDVEQAWNTLEELGLRRKLIELEPRSKQADSLALLMEREPLRSKPLGTGRGNTAAELGLDLVAHETVTPLALESITRSKQGWVNAFVSRENRKGEAAAFGEGFYTRVGSEGGRGTGLTIRFRLDPKARLGTDFLLESGKEYVVVLNKRALHVVPESLDANLSDWFKVMMMAGKRNLGVMLRLEARLNAKWHASSPKTIKAAKKAITEDIRNALDEGVFFPEELEMIDEWFKLRIGPEFFDVAVELAKATYHPQLLSFLEGEHWRTHPRFPELIEAVFEKYSMKDLLTSAWAVRLFSSPDVVARPEWVSWMKLPAVDHHTSMPLGQILSSTAAKSDPRWADLIEFHIRAGHDVFMNVGDSPEFENSPRWERWMKLLILEGRAIPSAVGALLSDRARKDPRWWQWIEAYTSRASGSGYGINRLVIAMMDKSISRDARWIEWARGVMRVPFSTDTGEELKWAKQNLVSAVLFEPSLLKTDIIDVGFREGGPKTAEVLSSEYFRRATSDAFERPDRLLMWMKTVPRKNGWPPTESKDILKLYADHPAFKGVFPYTPIWLFALVDRGWDLRDGRFQAPERAKPPLPFMRKPVNCPALFMK